MRRRARERRTNRSFPPTASFDLSTSTARRIHTQIGSAIDRQRNETKESTRKRSSIERQSRELNLLSHYSPWSMSHTRAYHPSTSTRTKGRVLATLVSGMDIERNTHELPLSAREKGRKGKSSSASIPSLRRSFSSFSPLHPLTCKLDTLHLV